MFLETPIVSSRLLLRTLTTEDVGERYLAWLRHPDVSRYLEIRFEPQTKEATTAYVQALNQSPDNLFLGIFLMNDETHIGNIKLGPIDPHHKRGDFGIVIGAHEHWGKGYASEAIEALTAFAFGALDLYKVTAGLYASNEGSRRAFLKAGWFEEGRRSRHWYSDGEWQDDVQLACFREDAR